MSLVDEIKLKADIVEVISSYVNLQNSGRNFKANCPFHEERTPSFVVAPERQSWRCFGACAVGGDVFSFVMRAENVDFGQALRTLAERVGVPLHSVDKGQTDLQELMYRSNELAAGFYSKYLFSRSGQAALKYLEERGLTHEVIGKFELGLSPEVWDGLKTYFSELDVSQDIAVKSGLIYKNQEGRSWDFFRGRLMFPIRNERGRIVGFGGRIMPSSGNLSKSSEDATSPKYINTPSTSIFDKQSTLYGLHAAEATIRRTKKVIVVEGYMDVIAAHQYGYEDVVASMGTALTVNQVNLLKSRSSQFILALDPDTAGQEATLRSLESSWKVIGSQDWTSGRNNPLRQRDVASLSIAELPAGKDPDELIRSDNGQWKYVIDEALPLIEFLLPVLATRFDLDSGQGKTQLVQAIYPLISIQNSFDQGRYLEMLAETLRVSLDALKSNLVVESNAGRRPRHRNLSTRISEKERSYTEKTFSDAEGMLDEYILALLLDKPELKDCLEDFDSEYFRKSENREIYVAWLSSTSIDELKQSVDGALHQSIDAILNVELIPADYKEREKALLQSTNRLKRQYHKELQDTLLTTSNPETPPSRDLGEIISKLNSVIKTTE